MANGPLDLLNRGSDRGSLAGVGGAFDQHYADVFNDPARQAAVAQSKADIAAAGFDPYGVGDGSPESWQSFLPNRNKRPAGGWTPEQIDKAQGLYRATTTTWAPSGASGGGYGGGAGAGTMGSAYTGGGGGGYVGGYELPGSSAAAQSLRDLQMGATQGLQGLMTRDTAAQRKAMEDALYASSARGINTAADRARQTMLEGTFGRGVGSSSILTELAGRQQQEHSDALAQAAREAFTQAGAEDRAELASLLGLNQGAFNSATAGLQGEANVALTNLARQQQESQFGRNLAFQGSENAANRAQAASQFGQNLGLQQSQLAQQNAQFGQNLGLNYAQLGQQNAQFGQNLDFQGTQNQLARDAAAAQSQAALAQQMAMLTQQQGFQGTQNDAQRELARYLAETGQTFTGQQNTQAQDAQLRNLMLTLEAQNQRAADSTAAGALGSGITGLGQLLAPLLAQWAK